MGERAKASGGGILVNVIAYGNSYANQQIRILVQFHVDAAPIMLCESLFEGLHRLLVRFAGIFDTGHAFCDLSPDAGKIIAK